MAKASSPIRLQDDLMQSAKSTAERFHRSAAEQIEYWAELGRSVSSTLDPDVLLSVVSGLTKIKIEPVHSPSVNPNDVFDALEREREDGSLSSTVTQSHLKYQASTMHPGFLERLGANGSITVGMFENGQFIPKKN